MTLEAPSEKNVADWPMSEEAETVQPVGRPRVFISYAQFSGVHSKRVLDLAQTLLNHGIDADLDQFHQHELLDWPRWCQEQLRADRSDWVLMVCSAAYRDRLERRVDSRTGKGSFWEGALIDDEIYGAKENSRFVPVLLDDEPEESIPGIVRGWTFCRIRELDPKDSGYEQLYRLLTQQPAVVKGKLGPVITLARGPGERGNTDAEDSNGPVSDSNHMVGSGAWSRETDYLRSCEQPPKMPEPTTLAAQPHFAPYKAFRDNLESPNREGAKESGDGTPEMVYLPSGIFHMGDKHGSADERPVHPIWIDAFALGRTPVTWGEYLRFCEATDSHWPAWLEEGSEYHIETGTNDYYAKHGIGRAHMVLPVVGIALEDARAYCDWLSQQTDERYALPTEAQWEYACRAGSTTRWYFGNEASGLSEFAWFSKNAGNHLHPVAQKESNAWGLYDMHGNVWEWCADWYAGDYYRQLTNAIRTTASSAERPISGSQQRSRWRQRVARALVFRAIDSAAEVGGKPANSNGVHHPANENPGGPESGAYRVVRGGALDCGADHCRSAFRLFWAPSYRSAFLGFRISRAL